MFRVAKPGTLIVYNATWVPERERALHRDTRFRQQKDFWDNPSFLCVFQKRPTATELLELYNYEDEITLVTDGFFAEVDHKAIDPEYLTDPRIVSPRETDYCCTKCGNSNLSQVRLDDLVDDRYQYDLYECMNHRCGFRNVAEEIYAQQTELEEGDYPAWHPEGTEIPEIRPANCSPDEFDQLKRERQKAEPDDAGYDPLAGREQCSQCDLIVDTGRLTPTGEKLLCPTCAPSPGGESASPATRSGPPTPPTNQSDDDAQTGRYAHLSTSD